MIPNKHFRSSYINDNSDINATARLANSRVVHSDQPLEPLVNPEDGSAIAGFPANTATLVDLTGIPFVFITALSLANYIYVGRRPS